MPMLGTLFIQLFMMTLVIRGIYMHRLRCTVLVETSHSLCLFFSLLILLSFWPLDLLAPRSHMFLGVFDKQVGYSAGFILAQLEDIKAEIVVIVL